MSPRGRRYDELPFTERQLQVLRLIEEGRASHGYSPTVREFLDPLWVSSTQAVQCLVEALRRKGLLVGERGSARTLRATEIGRQHMVAVTTARATRGLEAEVFR
jgi:SOS-response transcriptional repressor LexA